MPKILTAPIAGINFRPAVAREIIKKAANGSLVALEAEPDNSYDPDAIKVIVDGVHVGYVAAHSRNGLARHSDFHAAPELWATATLHKNDAGEARVRIQDAS